MKKIVLLAAVVLAITAGCGAETILSVNLEVYKNDSVQLNAIKMEDGYPTKLIPSGDYKIQIVDKYGKALYETPLAINFVLLSDPPVATDSAPLNLRIPYDKEMSRITLYNAEKKIFEKDIVVCDNDGSCEKEYESFLTCPKDCPLDKKDGICIKQSDGTCDPDCITGADPDCTEKNTRAGNVDYLVYAGLFILLILLVIYLAARKRRA